MLTRKHFEIAARQVRDIDDERDGYDYGDIETLTPKDGNINPAGVRARWVADAYAALFELENPRFNHAKFRAACGLKD